MNVVAKYNARWKQDKKAKLSYLFKKLNSSQEQFWWCMDISFIIL